MNGWIEKTLWVGFMGVISGYGEFSINSCCRSGYKIKQPFGYDQILAIPKRSKIYFGNKPGLLT